jgi:ferredoxin-NADP reductase
MILKKLSPMDFLKLTKQRRQVLDQAPADPVPADLKEYPINDLAARLHPAVQHLLVQEVKTERDDVRTYTLVPDEARGTRELAWFSAGQYLSVTLDLGEVRITRPYSLSSSPQQSLQGQYQLTIQNVPGGRASGYIFAHWQPGTPVTVSAPLGDFTYEPLRDSRTVVAVIGGSSITPLRSLARAVAEGSEPIEKLILLYGVNRRAEALFLPEFEQLAAQCPRFEYHMVYRDEAVPQADQGLLNAELIRKYAPQDGDYTIFEAGPQPMRKFMDEELPKLGLRRKFIRREVYGEVHDPAVFADYPGAAQRQFTLTVRQGSRTFTVALDAADNLLSGLEKAGISAPGHCRSGVCGWCRARLISGEVFIPEGRDDRRMADAEFGYLHPCTTWPLSDLALQVELPS